LQQNTVLPQYGITLTYRPVTLCIGILYCKVLQVTAILNTLQQTVMKKQWHYFRIWP